MQSHHSNYVSRLQKQLLFFLKHADNYGSTINIFQKFFHRNKSLIYVDHGLKLYDPKLEESEKQNQENYKTILKYAQECNLDDFIVTAIKTRIDEIVRFQSQVFTILQTTNMNKDVLSIVMTFTFPAQC